MNKTVHSMGNMLRPGWDVGNLPFVYTIQAQRGNDGLPELMPFRLSIDPRFNLFIQSYNSTTEENLAHAYTKGSALSGLMDDTGNGYQYATDFQRFINERISVRGCRILDIGCGTGYLISRLQADGASVLGLEPGEHGQLGAARYGVTIKRDYFPSKDLVELFGLISFFGVLEHVVDPVQFLGYVREQLAPGGTVALAVPNCGPYLAAGDISCLFHEHWSYFTVSSLRELLKSVFGTDPVIEESRYGGSLYASVSSAYPPANTAGSASSALNTTIDTFRAHAQTNIERVWRVLEETWGHGETVGIYVPWRAMNVLGIKIDRVRQDKIRFFDDNPLLRGTYYPGFVTAIENMNDLLASPPDRLLIMSNTFGEAIFSRLQQNKISIPIMTWGDFFR